MNFEQATARARGCSRLRRNVPFSRIAMTSSKPKVQQKQAEEVRRFRDQ